MDISRVISWVSGSKAAFHSVIAVGLRRVASFVQLLCNFESFLRLKDKLAGGTVPDKNHELAWTPRMCGSRHYLRILTYEVRREPSDTWKPSGWPNTLYTLSTLTSKGAQALSPCYMCVCTCRTHQAPDQRTQKLGF
jgi:hypothetical protein